MARSAKVEAIRQSASEWKNMSHTERERLKDELKDEALKDREHSLRNEADKTRENRLRRMANRQGLQIVKSKRRDPRALDYGKYMIADRNNIVVAGELNTGSALDLDEVERYLTAN